MFKAKDLERIKRDSISTSVNPQSCPTLWDLMDCSPPGFSVHGILQATILEWVAIPFSRGSSQPKDQTHVYCIARQILYHVSHERSPQLALNFPKFANLYSENILAFQTLWKNFSGNK